MECSVPQTRVAFLQRLVEQFCELSSLLPFNGVPHDALDEGDDA